MVVVYNFVVGFLVSGIAVLDWGGFAGVFWWLYGCVVVFADLWVGLVWFGW